MASLRPSSLTPAGAGAAAGPDPETGAGVAAAAGDAGLETDELSGCESVSAEAGMAANVAAKTKAEAVPNAIARRTLVRAKLRLTVPPKKDRSAFRTTAHTPLARAVPGNLHRYPTPQ